MDKFRCKRVIVLPDMQVPYEDKKTVAAVEAFMADHVWDICINLGDFLDFNELSSFNIEYPGKIESTASESFKAGNKILDRHLQILRKKNKNVEYVLIQGNHEYRTIDYTLRHPEVGTVLSVPKGLSLADRGVKYVKNWQYGTVYKLGNAHFVHGKYTNIYHAAKMVRTYGVCIYYGHTHDVQEHPVVTEGDGKTLVGKSLGCLCDYRQKYLKGNPTKWQQAFATFYVYPDGAYTEQTYRIFKHRFHALGRTYDGNKLVKK